MKKFSRILTGQKFFILTISALFIFIFAISAARLFIWVDNKYGFSETVKSFDKVREFDGVQNFREVILPGKIRSGILFRSSALSMASDDDADKLSGILAGGLILDFRTKWEVNHAPDREIDGVKDRNFPVRGVGDAAGYVDAFVMDPHDRKSFYFALEHIARTDRDAPILIHCTFGKDRTGWMVAILMYMAGASDSQVMTEYLRSNHQILGARVDAEWLSTGILSARTRYGSIENYVSEGLRLPESDMKKIREKLAP